MSAGDTDFPELWGVPEIAAGLKVDETTVYRWARANAGFPSPVAELEAGRVWIASDVRGWYRREQARRRRERAF